MKEIVKINSIAVVCRTNSSIYSLTRKNLATPLGKKWPRKLLIFSRVLREEKEVKLTNYDILNGQPGLGIYPCFHSRRYLLKSIY